MSVSDRETNGTASRALWMSTLAFAACIAVWTIFSIIGVRIKQDLGLTDTQFGLLAGTPILTGSLSRVALGVLADRFGGRLVKLVIMLTAGVSAIGLSYATTYAHMLLAALGLGLAGGAFAAGVAYVSKFYPPQRQGAVLGIYGAGNVGAAVTNFGAPFVMTVSAAARDGSLAAMARLLERAEQAKGRFVTIAARAARFYVPAVHGLAAATFLLWWAGLGAIWQVALVNAVCVLLITCPCALALAVPAVQVVASGLLFRSGVLIHSGDAIERLATVMQSMDDLQKAQLCAFAEGLAMALEHSKRAS